MPQTHKEYESKVPQSLIDVVYNKIIQDNMLNRMSATRSFCFYSEHFGCYYTKYYRFDSKTILAYDNTLEFCFSKDCDNCKKEVFEKEENITEMELADILGNIDYITLMYLAHKVGVFENENFQELAENATEIEKLTYQTQKLKYEISKMLKLLGIQSDPENVTAEELENYIKNYIESRQNDIYKEGNTQNATYRESLILGMFKRRK